MGEVWGGVGAAWEGAAWGGQGGSVGQCGRGSVRAIRGPLGNKKCNQHTPGLGNGVGFCGVLNVF